MSKTSPREPEAPHAPYPIFTLPTLPSRTAPERLRNSIYRINSSSFLFFPKNPRISLRVFHGGKVLPKNREGHSPWQYPSLILYGAVWPDNPDRIMENGHSNVQPIAGEGQSPKTPYPDSFPSSCREQNLCLLSQTTEFTCMRPISKPFRWGDRRRMRPEWKKTARILKGKRPEATNPAVYRHTSERYRPI